MSDARMEPLAVTGDDPRVRTDIAPLATERAFSWLRLLVLIAGTVVLLVEDEIPIVPGLFHGIFVVGWIYTLAVLWLEPYRRYPVLSSAWVTVMSDVILTLMWIVATGGAESAWQPALFAPAVGASLRLRPRDTLAVSLAAVGAYITLVTALGQLPGREAETVMFGFFVLFVATVCAVIARERHARLASRLAMLDLIQEVAEVGSWEYTLADGTITWSREQRRIFELPDDVAPTFESFYAAVHPDDREEVQRVAKRVLEEGGEHHLEHRLLLPSGRARWVECRVRMVLDEDGAPRQVVGTTQDITDAKKWQEQLAVGSKLASLGTLASGIAHEINNPLAYVATSLALARRRIDAGPLDDVGRASLESALVAAEDGTRRVAAIVRGLKVFSRADDTLREPVALSAVADAALAMASHEIGQRARLVRDYACDGQVLGSECRLLQVVLNLVVNAAHAIPDGAPDAHEIHVSIAPIDGGRVRLAIRDTGCGIPSELVPRLFEPFFTTKPLGVGTGLGLPICQRIVQELGGEITVDSVVGRGSTFHVILPAAPEAAKVASPAAPDELVPSSAASAPSRRLRVLVIDDEEIYARSLCMLLGIDHDVTFASDAGRALSLLCAGESFDVVLCDLMMGGISGMDLHEALASVQPAIVPRIVFLTGGATNERARAFLERDDIRCLDKPVPLATLRSTIHAVAQPTS